MTDSVKEKSDEIEKNIMSGLKDFQRATVERIAELYKKKVNRVLVSDEVGLGKTLIARGVIAKFVQLRKEEGDDLVKVVYVCSNGAIAEQNLNKLKITEDLTMDNISDSRLSMQHLKIAMQESDSEIKRKYIQLIPLTPHTSFHIFGNEGTVNERALMFAVLKRIPELSSYADKLEEFMICRAKKAWKDWCKEYYENKVKECDKQTDGKYLREMLASVRRELNVKQSDGSTIYEELIKLFNGGSGGETSLLVKVRTMFAKISIEKLDPDLVILDEFQRFKDLLDADEKSETGMLASKFFNDNKARMLLLSATPYKMYSTLDEIEEENADEHYEEFLRVLKFLNMTEEADREFRLIWSDYSVGLKEYASGSQAVLQVKNNAENALYSHICRTERMEAEGSADIIDDSAVFTSLEISDADISSYIRMSKLLNGVVKYGVPSDYVKSCPYLLSFMRDYKLKRDVEAYFKNHPEEIAGKLKGDTFFIKSGTVAKFKQIPCKNARLEYVMDRTLAKNAHLLLWIPPSKNYYTPTYPFTDVQDFTKTLVFSSWEMVPRMLASLISYEVERKTIVPLAEKDGKNIRYFANDTDEGTEESNKRHYPLPKLNFALKEGEPTAMSLFCLIYPSRFLAECYDPVDSLNRGLSLKQITKEVGQKISAELEKYGNSESGTADRRWYYVAPLLFDGGKYCMEYAEKMRDSTFDESRNKGYIAHHRRLLRICEDISDGKPPILGKRPDDLADVLTDMAIASPAVCAYRAYKCYFETFDCAYPTQIAKAFINRMNTPESTAVIELCARNDKGEFKSGNEDAHWQNVLTYCKAGNFQAMLDEYMHLMINGINDRSEKACAVVQNDILQSLAIRTTKYTVDTLDGFKARMNGKKEKNVAFRSHFAAAFTKGDGGDKDFDRKKTLKNAFNSPFRPFVLASTSIGQEGLDFHNYCRRIVHWNLPSNPIDLEQREGRINRYECLAIRQNIAKRYGNIKFCGDIWNEMFETAKAKECTEQTSELVPYWGLTERPDMVKIERIVPMYPFSRDEAAYERLMKILNLYRLTLGQARQEELLQYIMENRDGDKNIKEWFINLSPYYKERNK